MIRSMISNNYRVSYLNPDRANVLEPARPNTSLLLPAFKEPKLYS